MYKITDISFENVWLISGKSIKEIKVWYELDNSKMVCEDEVTFVSEKGEMMNKEYTKLQAIKDIIGRFDSVGETNADNERYFNLLELENVLKALITSLIYESQNVIDRRYSVNKSGNKAFEIIDEIYESTKEALIDLRNKL